MPRIRRKGAVIGGSLKARKSMGQQQFTMKKKGAVKGPNVHQNKYAAFSQAEKVASQLNKLDAGLGNMPVGRPPMSKKERKKLAKQKAQSIEAERKMRQARRNSGSAFSGFNNP